MFIAVDAPRATPLVFFVQPEHFVEVARLRVLQIMPELPFHGRNESITNESY